MKKGNLSKRINFPFDVFGASFYLISRYEEYLPHIQDHYNRFTAKESLAFKNGFLERPLINIWLNKLLIIIRNKYPDFTPLKREFKFISTIDIDNAYCYLEKGFLRSLGGFLRSIFQMNKDAIKERWRVLTLQQQDPYDTFDKQLELQQKYDLDVIYFILLGDYGLNDKNIPFQSRRFQLLIKNLADHARIGLHPSFGSNYHFDKLKIEIERLQNIIKREVTLSRQHFLKLSLPNTYRNLIDLGIQSDYTMGYASSPGFRASICNPFYFYDLETENRTSLLVFPFIIMDATLKYYLNLNPSESLLLIKRLMLEVKKVEGVFISLWHNETFSEHGDWEDWGDLYEDVLKYISE